MPTFNQLVRKGRQVLETKSTAPALLKSYDSQNTVSSESYKSSAGRERCSW